MGRIPGFFLFWFGICCLGLAHFPNVNAASYTEAPELQESVRAGRLPPLEQRLPTVPVVINPVERPGIYGGAWRMVATGYELGTLFSRSIGYEQLVRWDANWSRVVPNLASSWTINTNATVYRFRLRPGLRWSDGQPFGAKDIVAWVDDVARNRELSPDPPAWLVLNGRLPECAAPEEHLLEFRFAGPNALFLEQLAGMRANEMTRYAAHYHRPVHRQHNSAGAAALARQTDLPWADAFRGRFTPRTWRNAAMPTLDAWVLSAPYAPGTSPVIARRNPYYWKVDTLGRQLPYLDRVEVTVAHSHLESSNRVLAGEVDYQREGVPISRPRLRQAQADGQLRLVKTVPSIPGQFALSLNLTHRDPELRRIVAQRSVRIALSKSIDRQRIIREMGGDGRPWQIAPRPESPFYHRRLGTQYTEYDPATAQAMLDEAGLRPGEKDGLRQRSNGRPFSLRIVFPDNGNHNWPAILRCIQENWRAVGVAMDWQPLPRNEFATVVAENRHDGVAWWGAGGHSATLEPEFYVPATFERLGPSRVFYAVPWARWFVDPLSPGAEAPPASVQGQMALFRQVMAELNEPVRLRLMQRVIDIAAEEFYVMGIHLEEVGVAPLHPTFRNVPTSHFDSWLYPDPGPLNPCQFFHDSTR